MGPIAVGQDQQVRVPEERFCLGVIDAPVADFNAGRERTELDVGSYGAGDDEFWPRITRVRTKCRADSRPGGQQGVYAFVEFNAAEEEGGAAPPAPQFWRESGGLIGPPILGGDGSCLSLVA